MNCTSELCYDANNRTMKWVIASIASALSIICTLILLYWHYKYKKMAEGKVWRAKPDLGLGFLKDHHMSSEEFIAGIDEKKGKDEEVWAKRRKKTGVEKKSK